MPKPSELRYHLRNLLQPENASVHAVLTGHFVRQFFQSSSTAAVETPLVRALAGIAAPMLITAFWIVTLAHNLQPWGAAGIHYLFVLYSFCAMGCVTTLQWERLFPARLDFLVLLPMPLRGISMFAAKLRAVGVLLGLFLVAANVFGLVLLPALAGLHVFSAMAAQAAAVLCAGIASSLAVLALEALVVALAPDRWMRVLVPTAQAALIAAFVFVFLQVISVMEHLPNLQTSDNLTAKFFPPLWFSSMYEVCMGGPTATAFSHALVLRAALCIPALLILTLLLYPLAWAKRKRSALEGTRASRLRDARLCNAVVHALILRRPDSRAVFHFMRQTLARLGQYHARLAAYVGAGVAMSLAIAVRIAWRGTAVHPALRPLGVQAVMPLLLFWTVVGLRTAFLLPADLGARWIFRLAGLRTPRVVTTAKLFVVSVCCFVTALLLAALAIAGLRPTELFEQAVYGICCAVLLTDVFFFLQAHIPFTRPLLTERSSLPFTLAVYVFGMPTLVLLVVTLERWAGHRCWRIAAVCGASAATHALLHWLRQLPSHPVSEDSFLDELSDDFQTLSLST